jgi:hypothetical protein
MAARVVVAALVGGLGYRSLAGSSSSARAPIVAEPSTHRPHDSLRDRPGDLPGQPQGDRHGALGVADGEVPDGVTIFDDAYPAVANLDPALLGALRQAATDAAGDGVEFFVNSGWRSPEYQEQLLDEAVSEYGSREEAARWVATPTRLLTCRGRGRHRALRRHGVAIRARRRVRAVPDLPQRTLALRTAPRSHQPWLSFHVCQPHARSKDAAVTSTLGAETSRLSLDQCCRVGRSICLCPLLHGSWESSWRWPCHRRPRHLRGSMWRTQDSTVGPAFWMTRAISSTGSRPWGNCR